MSVEEEKRRKENKEGKIKEREPGKAMHQGGREYCTLLCSDYIIFHERSKFDDL